MGYSFVEFFAPRFRILCIPKILDEFACKAAIKNKTKLVNTENKCLHMQDYIVTYTLLTIYIVVHLRTIELVFYMCL